MAKDDKSQLLRMLPAVGELIADPALADVREKHPRTLVVRAIRNEIDHLRAGILGGQIRQIDQAALYEAIRRRAAGASEPRLQRVINATGVIVHTNLGRSPLAASAVTAVVLAAQGYSNLEYDLESGQRGHRDDLVEGLLCELTGAEAALVVNNNAAAVLLALATVAAGREVVVSRGELVEIGGSFRIPDVLKQSGARLVEVGTTNRTHPSDYEAAIGPNTAALLKVHSSNYRIMGFTTAVSGAELAELARRRGVVSIEDLGSGSLLSTDRFGLPAEPTAAEVVAHGLDLVTFSGDKLLGGPQAGVLVGRRDLIRACASNPLRRALRLDKMTLAALEATLRLYRDPDAAVAAIPTLHMLSLDETSLQQKAERMANRLREAIGAAADVSLAHSTAQVGGGALPLTELPGPVLAIRPATASVTDLTTRLRNLATPIIVRIEDDRIIADPRTILDGEETLFHNGMVEALTGGKPEEQ